MLYNPPTGGAANDPYIGANIAAGIQGSKVPPNAVEYPQRELVALITASGLAPTNTDLQQVLRAVRSGVLEYSLDIGNVNAPAITPSPAHTTLVDGLHVRVRMKAAPTGPSTFSVSSLVAPIQYLGGSALAGGDWAANDIVDLVYNAGRNAFQFLGLSISQVEAQIAAQVQATGLLVKTSDTSTAANTLTTKGENRTLTSYSDGLQLEIVPQFTNTAATTINIDGVGAKSVLRNDGSALVARDLAAGAVTTMMFDATLNAFRIIGFAQAQVPHVLPPGSSPTIYVRPDGSDLNNGSANTPSGAFQTILAAATYGLSAFSLSGGALTIQLGIPGTYAPPGFVPPVFGTLNIVGDTSGTNQAGYVISGPGPATGGPGLAGLFFFQGGTISLSGVTIQNTAARNHHLIAQASFVTVKNVTWTTTVTNNQAFLTVSYGGSVVDAGGCIYGSSMGYLAAAVSGYITFTSNPTVQNTPAFSVCTVFASQNGIVTLNPGVTFSGSATGQKYLASLNGIIETYGAGANAFPGSTAGTYNTGGQYV